MTIAACLYHGEVIFPRPDEIVNGRYIRRRARMPPVVNFSKPTDKLEYCDWKMRFTQVSRPLRIFHFAPEAMLTEWECRDIIDHALRDGFYRIRTKLHELERFSKERFDEMEAARKEFAMFLRKASYGAYDSMPAMDYIYLKEVKESKLREAENKWNQSIRELDAFKENILPQIWPVNRKGASE